MNEFINISTQQMKYYSKITIPVKAHFAVLLLHHILWYSLITQHGLTHFQYNIIYTGSTLLVIFPTMSFMAKVLKVVYLAYWCIDYRLRMP